MRDDEALAWLGRKIVWGFAPGQWQEWQQLGPQGVIDRLVDADDYGVDERRDPFAAIEYNPDRPAEAGGRGVASWMEDAVTTPRPFETFMQFFWSDYFAVSLRAIRPPMLMFQHMNLLGQHALGNFARMLRAVTIDPAMLVFLDGETNTSRRPNENYGRELLELYSVGVGNFTEGDVKAAAQALTGWVVRRFELRAEFRPNRHDSTPQTLLGVPGVNDVFTAIEAVLAHPETAKQVVHKLAFAILGDGYRRVEMRDLVADFAADYELRPILRRLLEMAVDDAAKPALIEPVAWYVTARKFTTARPEGERLREFFRAAGQIPMLPPNVGGFPEASAYLSTSATIARFNFAAHLAERSERYPSVLAQVNNIDDLAMRLGLVNGFLPETRAALESLADPVDRMAAALASPDLIVV